MVMVPKMFGNLTPYFHFDFLSESSFIFKIRGFEGKSISMPTKGLKFIEISFN